MLIQERQSDRGEKLGLNCNKAFLFDGQTAEVLAWTEDGPACKHRTDGTLEASHFGIVMERGGADLDATLDFINEKMRR